MRNSNKKVVVSCATMGAGGAERVLSVLSYAFADNYDEVIYITWIDVPYFYEIDKRVQKICIENECKSNSLLKKMYWFRKYVQRQHPSIVLSFLDPYNVVVCSSLIFTDVLLIVASRNDPRKVWGDFIHRHIRAIAYRRADGILSQTLSNMQYFRGDLLDKSYVIYNPLFLPREYIGKALGVKKDKLIVSVARLTCQKNLKMLIKAFSIVHLTHKDYTLIIYGEGPCRSELESFVEEMNLQSNIFFPGATKDVWKKILSAQCFVLSSWFEGMPNSLFEAMSLGLPCISTKVSGAIDFIKSGENGILIDINDYKMMANAITDVIDNASYAYDLGNAASEIYENFKQDKICNKWIDYLNTIMM